MNDHKDKLHLTGSILEDLMQLTKSALYRIAQTLGIPGRSTMNKNELVDVLSQTTKENSTAVDTIRKHTSPKNAELLSKIPSSMTAQEKPVTVQRKITPVTPGQIPPVTANSKVQSSPLSSKSESAPATAIQEPDSVWVGETGPELPNAYGATVLRALPRDPNWVYLYWEITEETRHHIQSVEGAWIFDTTLPCVRVHDEKGETIQEIPVLLDASNWYISVSPNRSYEFELGLRKPDGSFVPIARSNRIAMPAMEPSTVTDEEWAMVSDEFEEVLYNAAGVDRVAGGSSVSMIPQVLRHRMRVPWAWNQEQWASSQLWPSSQAFLSSSTVVKNH